MTNQIYLRARIYGIVNILLSQSISSKISSRPKKERQIHNATPGVGAFINQCIFILTPQPPLLRTRPGRELQPIMSWLPHFYRAQSLKSSRALFSGSAIDPPHQASAVLNV